MSTNKVNETPIQIIPAIIKRIHYGVRIAHACRKCQQACLLKYHYRAFKLHKNGVPVAYYINVANLLYENDFIGEVDMTLQNCHRVELTQLLSRPVQFEKLPLVIKVDLNKISHIDMCNQLSVIRDYYKNEGHKVRFDIR